MKPSDCTSAGPGDEAGLLLTMPYDVVWLYAPGHGVSQPKKRQLAAAVVGQHHAIHNVHQRQAQARKDHRARQGPEQRGLAHQAGSRRRPANLPVSVKHGLAQGGGWRSCAPGRAGLGL